MPGRCALSLTIAVAGLVLLTSPVDAGADFALNIKKMNGTYAREVFANIAPGNAKDFTLRVTGPTDLSFPIVLEEGDPDAAGYKTKYFRNDNNITGEVEQLGGYEFNLGSDGKQKFRMRVKVTSETPPAPFCRDVDASESENAMLTSTVIAQLNGSLCKF
jgi:hypothetical protein